LLQLALSCSSGLIEDQEAHVMKRAQHGAVVDRDRARESSGRVLPRHVARMSVAMRRSSAWATSVDSPRVWRVTHAEPRRRSHAECGRFNRNIGITRHTPWERQISGRGPIDVELCTRFQRFDATLSRLAGLQRLAVRCFPAPLSLVTRLFSMLTGLEARTCKCPPKAAIGTATA
jgi:hypothetical protein